MHYREALASVYKDMCLRTLAEVLHVTVKNWKQLKYSLRGESINKLCIHIKNEIQNSSLKYKVLVRLSHDKSQNLKMCLKKSKLKIAYSLDTICIKILNMQNNIIHYLWIHS